MDTRPDPQEIERLQAEHTPSAIRRRLAASPEDEYLGDAVLGAIDGAITTFAVVAATLGGELAPGVALILGFSNLVADGFSMAASNYQRVRSEHDRLARARSTEARHIEVIPEGERAEVRALYSRQGFEPPLLDEIVAHVTADRQRWIDTMVRYEWGLATELPKAGRAAWTTFLAFVTVGTIPLLPLLTVLHWGEATGFGLSIAATMTTFFAIGAVKGRILEMNWLREGLGTFLIGGGAALLAWSGGALIRRLIEGLGFLG